VGVGVVLAGCGAAQGSADGGAGQASDQGSDQGSDAVKGAISKSVVPVGGGRVFPDQRVVVTQPSSGEFKAFSAICTHQGCIVSDVSGGTINCGCHGSQFDIATGDVRRGPATQPLPGKTVSVGSNGITVS
jgi:Rieske Fe-S protein